MKALGLVILALSLFVFGWIVNTPAGLLGKADAVGYAVCHRIDLRSFHLGERPMPLCARCTGMYLGALLGLGYQFVTSRRRGGLPPRRLWPVLAALALAFALDGLNSFLTLVPGAPTLFAPHNTLRLLTGSGMGVVLAAALFPAFNQTAWKGWDSRPALADLRSLGALLGLTLLLDAAVLLEDPRLLYPLALISAAGVLVVLTLAYSVVCLMLIRADNRFQRWGELALPMMGGFAIGLLQIAALDLVRFWVTGTWDGFHLG